MSLATPASVLAPPPVLDTRVLDAFNNAALVLAPPPVQKISEWADGRFVLSSEDSVAAGPISLDVTPYLREMLDAVLDPRAHEFVFWTGAQLGKTTVLKILLAYFMSEDPSPILYMMPTLQMAKKWSRVRLASMIRDNPALRELFEVGARKAENSVLFKIFAGGWLNIVGANSPSEMSSWPMRIVLADEEDRYPMSAGAEGDPVTLAAERTDTWESFAKIVHASTCTIEGLSRIAAKYAISDRRRWWMPCPQCGELQQLKWPRMIKDPNPPHEGTCYPCEHCGGVIEEKDKRGMLARGRWIAERPEISNCVGFWMNSLNSPFVTWAKLAEKWFAAQHHREDPQKLKTFINLSLAETYKDYGESLESGELMKRCEHYGAPGEPAAPAGVIVVTASVDVQADRLEYAAIGWGRGEEAWSIDHKVFSGDPATPRPWTELEEFLKGKRYLHARGVWLEIAALFIDSGYLTAQVYAWAKKMQSEGARVWPSKGVSPSWGKPALMPISKSNKHRVRFYPVSIDVIKELLYKRLKIADAGAGYLHFTDAVHTKEYFDQLTCERLVPKNKNGFPLRVWEKPVGARNEALDLTVYAYAAFLSLGQNPKKLLERLEKDLHERARAAAAARREPHPDQLALLPEAAVQTSAGREAVDGQWPMADGPDRPAPSAIDHRPSAADLGEHEYKLAEQTDTEQREPAPPRPRARKVRRSSWSIY